MKNTSVIYIDKNNIEISCFDISLNKSYYILEHNNTCLKINKETYILFNIIDNNKNIDEIISEYYKITNKLLDSKTLINFINNSVEKYDFIWTNEDNTLKNRNRNSYSYIYIKTKILKYENIKHILFVLKYTFSRYLFLPLLLISIAINLSMYIFTNYQTIINTNISTSYLEILSLLILGSFIHELGHAAGSLYYKIRPADIGFGLYLYFPVFYTNITNIWRLQRKKRIIINIGGIYFQSIFTSILIFIYYILKKESLLSVVYLTHLSFLAILNPMLRWDGYWIVSDFIGIPNLKKNTNIVINYIFRLILKKKTTKPEIINELNKNTKLVFISYIVISIIFFITFYCFIAYIFPKTIFDIFKDVKTIINNIYTYNNNDIFKIITSILFKITMVIFVLRFLIKKTLK